MRPSWSRVSLRSIAFRRCLGRCATFLVGGSAALQAAADGLTGRFPRLVVERISALEPDLFASDGFHPNQRAHAVWGEEIAALALPLVE